MFFLARTSIAVQGNGVYREREKERETHKLTSNLVSSGEEI